MKFYKNMFVHKNNLYVREFDNGIENRIKKRITPSFYFVTEKESKYKSIYGHNLIKLDFDSTYEAKEWVDQYETQKHNIFGFNNHEYVMLNQMYPGQIEYDLDNMLIGIVDIETENEGTTGFATAETAHEKINLISLTKRGLGGDSKIYCFGWGDAKIDDPDAVYVKCRDEIDLLKRFVNFWKETYVDVITAWNISFDIPYIVKRIEIVLGEDYCKMLSPYRIITSKVSNNLFGREYTQYFIGGVTVLDYLELYRKFKPKVQESYKLDYIAKEELKDNKVEYDCTFKEFYTNYYQKFVEYNIHDVRLVAKLDKKLGYLALAATIGFSAKVALEDVTGTVRVWDVIINNYLAKNNIHVPSYGKGRMDAGKYGGGYVKSPIVGFYEWLMSIDATSLYPSIIIKSNVSPETMVSPAEFIPLTPDDVLLKSEAYQKAIEKAIELNATLCANGAMFYKDRQGVIPELTSYYFDQRVKEKKLGKKYEGVALDIKKILKSRGVEVGE